MNKRDWEYEKYGGYLDPEDNVFFGPISKRELKRSVEVAEKLLRRKRNAKVERTAFEPIQEICEKADLDGTFDVNDAENIDPASETTKQDLNRTYELDESQNPCMCPQIEKKDTDYENKNEISTQKFGITIPESDDLDCDGPHLISILSNPLKDVSNLNETLAKTKISALEVYNSSNVLSDGSRNTPILKTGSLLDDTCSTVVKGGLQTPLLAKVRKSGPTRANDKRILSLDKTLTNENSVCDTTRIIKLSDTFITELLPENCLINSSLNDLTHQRTPDVFQQKRNEIWLKNSTAKKPVGGPPQSKLPLLKKTPKKSYLLTKSPVADYIHKGISVQSASKNRHSYCLNDLRQKSKSEQKGVKLCKIPISTNAFVKRKLLMDETKLMGLKK